MSGTRERVSTGSARRGHRRAVRAGIAASVLAISAMVAALLATPAAAGGGGGGCHDDEVTQGRGTASDLKNNCFLPTLLRVDPGQPVTWSNGDGVEHTVTGVAGSFGDFDPIRPGGSVTFAFDQEGVYPYFCAYHPGMVGAVLVGDANGPGAAAGSGQVVIEPPAGDEAGAEAASARGGESAAAGERSSTPAAAGDRAWPPVFVAIGLGALVLVGVAADRRRRQATA